LTTAIESERDFWLAETNLDAAVRGGNAGSASPQAKATTAAAAESAGGH
jgi:hypothetical protein